MIYYSNLYFVLFCINIGDGELLMCVDRYGMQKQGGGGGVNKTHQC